MNVEVKKVKLTELKLNPDNPRTISKRDMDRLVKSLTEFPDMLSIREIVVDENMTVLGGNMRLQALKRAGAKDCIAKIVSGLSTAQKREFVIKDNSNFGEFDIDLLANEWSDMPLVDWGVDLPEDWFKKDDAITDVKEESEFYALKFNFTKDDASFVQTVLHDDLSKHKEEMDDHWRERCLLRILRKSK